MTKITILRLVFLFTSVLAANIVLFAQSPSDADQKSFHIGVKGVNDRHTEAEIYGANFKLVNALTDSVIRSGKAYRQWEDQGRVVKSSSFKIKNIPFNGHYKLIISCPGYEESQTEIDGTSLDPKQFVVILENIFLDKKAKELSEVTVQATKVKFYNKGDTLVYNADALVMAEGSMLDDIIRQLPGVELKENGKILVNGEFVESLLLNGKDFFKGNHELMLKNLAAYTVKNIEVYERQKDIDRLLGEDYGKKILTMDVKLKKEYHHNFMGNVEAGYGTEDRYLGRLFAMWNSDHARVSLIGNVNNMNETRKPGMDDTFTPDGIPSGTLKTYMGGVEYNVESKRSGWEINGDVVVNRTVLDDGSRTYTTNFLPSGNTFGREFSSKINKDFKISTNHLFKSMGKWHYVEIHPIFDYNKANYSSSLDKAVFDTEIQTVTSEMIRNIFDGTHASAVESMLNRELREQLDKGHNLNARLWSNGRFRLKTGLIQSISYLVSGSYLRNSYDGFNRFGINFGNNVEFSDVSDRYLKNHPDYNYNVKAAAGYQVYPTRNIALDIYYEYSHNERNATSDLYCLDQLYGDMDKNGIGFLPSYNEYFSTFDPSLSYVDHQTNDLHTLSPNLQWRLGKSAMRVKVDVSIENQHIDYLRDNKHHILRRTRLHPGNMEFELKFPIGKLENYKGSFYYTLAPKSPDLRNMIDIVDRRDPMNVFIGNPDLKNSTVHRFCWRVYGHNKGNIQQTYMLSSSIYNNLLSVGYDYNTETGVKTSWMQNVNGNWDINALQQLHWDFGHMRRFFLENETRLNYVSSVDFFSENSEDSFRNKVNNYGVGEELKFGYNNAGNKAEVFFKGNLHHYNSEMLGFSSFNAGDFNYGMRGILKLPANLQIATDFTIYSRRGYSDIQLNTNNFVWNARLSYSIPKTGITLMADGFDLLHNLSNVSYRINAQARTETYYTVLPRYFLFHVQWTFSKKNSK
ncbi:MAG: carboxypeptidase-like regulatory domain-containing protein [Bacteroides sp.]|nr:carboxypeptidase-like regulatory domain-containing protein [Bacteroides sp.]